MSKESSNTLPMRYSSFPTNWWQGKMSPSGVTATYSQPAPQPRSA